MNTAHVSFQLGEALIHLQNLVAELRDGRMQADDTPGLAVDLGHVLDHLCRAWNCRNLSLAEALALPPEEYERLTDTVPNFNGSRTLGEGAMA